MKAKLRGTELYLDIAGMQLRPHKSGFKQYPVLFMLHGGPGGDHLRFKEHSLELEEVAQLVFIDHRGCGRSKKTQQSDYSLENNIEDIEALRKYLGLERICILGASYGGMVAQGYAIRYSKHLAKLILAATAPSYHFMAEAQQFVHLHGNAKQQAICETLWQGSFKNHQHVIEFFKAMDTMYSVKKGKKKSSYTQSDTVWSHQALNEGIQKTFRHFNYINKLKKITCPTLILAGEKDWICSVNQAKIIAQYVPQHKLKIFKNCGHALAVDAHRAYISAIKSFLQKDAL
jgi:proline iminopeptidase